MAYADPDDVQAILEPDPDKLLDIVEAIIKSRIPDLDERCEDPNYAERVIAVESAAVARLMRNPEGLQQESEGDYSVSLRSNAASGYLLITDDEWAWLGVGAGISTVAPSMPPDRPGWRGCTYTWCWEWNCPCRF